MRLSLAWVLTFLASFRGSLGVYWNVNDTDSINNATALVATGLLDYYTGLQYGNPIGMFSSPYYWWEAGGAWGSILDFWWYTGNTTYNGILKQALLAQTGNNNDYVPLNQSVTEGNDDQAFWGLVVMAAAERNFENPAEDEPQWLYLAQAVFNTMALRWDDDTCGGGLRWQIFTWNSGYDYKNTVSNGALFHIAARLARYTGNTSYVDWAEKVFDWMKGIDLLEENGVNWVYDGAKVEGNCTNITKLVWTYNQGLLMSGSAYLWNMTQDEKWHTRAWEFLNGSEVFFNNSVLYEVTCQSANSCNTDQRSFKAYFSRFLGLTAQLVPESRSKIMGWIRTSAAAAAQSCSGGTDGHTCGLNWFYDGWDGYYGLGEQMAALEIMQNVYCLDRPAPYTAETGGTSIGNGAAGTETQATNLSPLTITTGSRAAAGIITAVIGLSIIACTVWLVI
ncbi:LAME_0G14422g1_1 [Lachancea meyersii CBS 8951]|uniref:Mannan endo-1,6-alpha-mannosidase n=1 Tax=Lachancea meyersii CBS 8951 TaxID=1266667 RepID=A0A1G4KAE0_9SACH|nr:LAME_0G14422g1_1 [Lachancea meyersii CBS 8951]